MVKVSDLKTKNLYYRIGLRKNKDIIILLNIIQFGVDCNRLEYYSLKRNEIFTMNVYKNCHVIFELNEK